MYIFLAIVLAHWVEHLSQAAEIFILGWPRPQSGGFLGLLFPVLVSSEGLHYFYAVVMLIGLAALLPGCRGRAKTWWTVALGIQVWHHFEHLLLLGQVVVHQNLFGLPVPTSIAQLFFPRVELHLFYNAVVFAPMAVAMWFHIHPTREELHEANCSCAVPQMGKALSSPA